VVVVKLFFKISSSLSLGLKIWNNVQSSEIVCHSCTLREQDLRPAFVKNKTSQRLKDFIVNATCTMKMQRPTSLSTTRMRHVPWKYEGQLASQQCERERPSTNMKGYWLALSNTTRTRSYPCKHNSYHPQYSANVRTLSRMRWTNYQQPRTLYANAIHWSRTWSTSE